MNSQQKNTIIYSQRTINCGGKLISLEKPLVMGILNLTPDSFFDGGKNRDIVAAMKHTEKMLAEGAAFIDIGAVSTRPGAAGVTAEEEEYRLIPVLNQIAKEFPDAIISVDTFRSQTAIKAVDCGAQMINDISAGGFDKEMFATIARLRVPYIIMHIQGTPADMQQNPVYNDVVKEIIFYMSDKVGQLRQLGVNDVIIDPGFGFGKTVEHNYELLNNLHCFSFFELPLLAGLSRKSMINKVLGCNPENALNGTTVLNTIALLKGANILRVHDVKEAVEAVRLVGMYANH